MSNETRLSDEKVTTLEVNDDDLDFDDDVRTYRDTPFSGVGVTRFPGGVIESETPYLNGLPHGVCREWHVNGQKKKEWASLRGSVHGTCTEWYENGERKSLGVYEHGIEITFTQWSGDGRVVEHRELPSDSPMRQLIERLKKANALL